MQVDIILAGVGGQGILTIAAGISLAALNNNLNVKQAETHGMSQRGGDVYSFLRISDKEIYADIIPQGEADIVLAVEPMEALRYAKHLKKDGYIITNNQPFKNIPNYPDTDKIVNELQKYNNVILDADKLAKEAGSARASNIVMLGAASPFINMDVAELEKAIAQIFGRKGDDVVKVNIDALHKGRDFANQNS